MPDRRPLCILLVEDDRDSRAALCRLLELHGHVVCPAATAAEAVVAARARRPDVIVSDVGLPDGSGIELMRRLSSDYRVPGVAVSGYGDDADVRRCAEAGFGKHLCKPLDFQMLLDAIDEMTA